MKSFLPKSHIPVGFVLIFSCILFSVGCTGMQSKPGEVFDCGAVHSTLAPEAELAEFSCVVKEWNGANVLFFNVGIKNVSTADQRYKINIFLDNGKAVGGLLPRKTKKGLVKPGDIARFSYPVAGMTVPDGDVELLVKTMGQ